MDKTWKVVLAFIGIFVAGLVVGGLVTLRVVKGAAGARIGSPEQFGPQLLKRYTAKLELTPDQQEKIKPLIARAAEELRQMRRATWSNSQLVIERVEGEIAAQLSPEQKTKFDQMLAEQRERIKRFIGERARRQKDNRGPDAGPSPPQ
jgi:uncharacterized membrane protein